MGFPADLGPTLDPARGSAGLETGPPWGKRPGAQLQVWSRERISDQNVLSFVTPHIEKTVRKAPQPEPVGITAVLLGAAAPDVLLAFDLISPALALLLVFILGCGFYFSTIRAMGWLFPPLEFCLMNTRCRAGRKPGACSRLYRFHWVNQLQPLRGRGKRALVRGELVREDFGHRVENGLGASVIAGRQDHAGAAGAVGGREVQDRGSRHYGVGGRWRNLDRHVAAVFSRTPAQGQVEPDPGGRSVEPVAYFGQERWLHASRVTAATPTGCRSRPKWVAGV